jgi:hypothetical protein
MNKETALDSAKHWRKETIRELMYFIEALQHDLDRLTKADTDGDDSEGVTPQKGNSGYYLSQHCLRYEQTVKAGQQMETMARVAMWCLLREQHEQQEGKQQ